MRGLCVLALLMACAPNGTNDVAPAQPVFPVRQTVVYPSSSDWQGTPWYRSSDLHLAGPVYVLFADGDRACVVNAQIWTRVVTGAWLACPTGWRAPRHRAVLGATQR